MIRLPAGNSARVRAPCLIQFPTRQGRDRIERNFAHKFGTGGLDRLHLGGMENVHKKFLSLRTLGALPQSRQQISVAFFPAK